MSGFSSVLSSVIPVFLVIGCGLVFRKAGILTKEVDDSLFKVILRLLIPCLIIDSVLGNPALVEGNNAYVSPIFGFIFISFSFLFARLVSLASGLNEVNRRRTFAMTVGLQNWGYMAIPLVAALYDRETLGVLFAHNLGVEFGLWSVGIMVLTGGSLGGSLLKAINPPVVTIFTCLVLNYLGFWAYIPQIALNTAGMLAPCAIPMSLILVGAAFYDNLKAVQFRSDWQVAATGSLMRLLILPVCMLGAACLLPLSTELRQVVIVQAAMPCGVFPVFICRHYGGHAPTALLIVLATSVAGLLTIPLWVYLGTEWLLK